MKTAADVIGDGVGKAKTSDTVHVPIAWDVAEPPGSWWLTVKVVQGTRGALTPEASAAQVARLIKRHACYSFWKALANELGGVSDG